MYLLVVVTLVIGMLSIYAQVLGTQAARIAAKQTGLAANMSIWHGAAVSMAKAIISTAPGGLTYPCSLSYASSNTGVARCVAPTGAGSTGTAGSPTGTVTDNAGTPLRSFITGSTERVHLPSDYATAQYQFYSVLYRDPGNNQPVVVTFVKPAVLSTSNPAPGYISLPTVGASTRQTSFTSTDLLRQFKVFGISNISYGTVISGEMITASTDFQYAMPPNVAGLPVVADGSVGIVTSP